MTGKLIDIVEIVRRKWENFALRENQGYRKRKKVQKAGGEVVYKIIYRGRQGKINKMKSLIIFNKNRKTVLSAYSKGHKQIMQKKYLLKFTLVSMWNIWHCIDPDFM